jgi:hypothetical protein
MWHYGSIERRHSWNAGLRQRFRHVESRWNRANPAVAVVDRPGDGGCGTGEDEWTSFGIPEEERRLFEHQKPNVLIIGSGPSVERIVRLLERTSIPPIVRCDACPLTLPPVEVGTLVISHVERLSTVDQQLLFAWLSFTAPRRQVITTADVPLFPAVVRNTFSEALFYRLNAMCLMLRDAPVPHSVRKSSQAG